MKWPCAFIVAVAAGAGSPPTINGTNGTIVYYYYSPRPYAFRVHRNQWIKLLPWLVITDTDSASLGFASVALDHGASGADKLYYPNRVPSIVGYYSKGGSVVGLFGSATVQEYQTALRSLEYRASNSLSLKQRPNQHSRTAILTVVDLDDNAVTSTSHMLIKTARTCITDVNPVRLER